MHRRVARSRIASTLRVFACTGALGALNAAGAPFAQSNEAAIAQVRGELHAAYGTARAWLDALEPPSDNARESLIDIPTDCAGVCAIIRNRGKPLGIAVALAKEHERSPGPTLTLRRALGRAISQTLGDPSVSGMPPELRDAIGPQLVLELEFAGPLIPLVGRSIDRLAAGITPGADGMAVRFKDRMLALFPSQMRAMGLADDPQAAMQALALETGLSLDDLKTIGSRSDVSVYRFATTHMAGLTPAREPVELSHGDVVVPIEAVTLEGLAQFTSNLALHLMSHRWPGEEQVGLLGDYNPVADRYEPLVAPPLDQALCAWSLARFARSPAAPAHLAVRARGEAANILARLGTVETVEADPLSSPAAAGAILLAALELGFNYESESSTDQLQPPIDLEAMPMAGVRDFLAKARLLVIDAAKQAALRYEQQAEGEPIAPPPPAFDPSALALIAHTVTRLHEAGDADATPALARRLAAAAEHSVPPSQQITLMPFLAYAWAPPPEAEFGAREAVSENSDGPRARFGELFEAVMKVMHTAEAPDVHSGGFVLESAQADRYVALPNAQSVRAAAFVAACLASSKVQPDEDRQALLAAVRFLMQLAVRDETRAIQPNFARAKGGIRASLADMRQPLPAQALALMAAVDALHALAHSGNAGIPAAPSAP